MKKTVAAYETPASRIIEVNLNHVLMNSTFTAKGSSTTELDELEETTHSAITWN